MAAASGGADTTAAKHDVDKTAPVSGISQFLGRVLEQLSLSSWMPAAMLVGNAAILVKLHANDDGLNIASAFGELTRSPLGVLVVFLLALVLATVLIQAFEFECIRLMEGYLSHSRGPILALARKRIRRHASKRQKLSKAYATTEREQFARARTAMLALPTPISQHVLDAIERDVHGHPQTVDVDEAVLDAARELEWATFLGPEDAYRLDAIDSRLGRYPDPHRILPTRLGNAMRAAEDTLTLDDDENLEGYVLRHHQDLPDLLKNEHHDYRVRLEMYAGLLTVFALLTIVALAALAGVAAWWQTVLVAGLYAGLGWVAYEACISSAFGYGDVLREIDRHITPTERTAVQPGENTADVSGPADEEPITGP